MNEIEHVFLFHSIMSRNCAPKKAQIQYIARYLNSVYRQKSIRLTLIKVVYISNNFLVSHYATISSQIIITERGYRHRYRIVYIALSSDNIVVFIDYSKCIHD